MWGGMSDCNRHPLLWSDGPTWTVTHPPLILHCNQLLLVASVTGIPLHVGIHQAWDWCTSPTPVNPTPKGRGSKIMLWVDSGLATTQCQTSQTSLGWINGKLWLLPWMSTGASTEDRWRLQVMCSWSGCLEDHIHLAEGVDASSLLMPLGSRLNDCHDYSQNWVTVATPYGVWNG